MIVWLIKLYWLNEGLEPPNALTFFKHGQKIVECGVRKNLLQRILTLGWATSHARPA